MTYQITARKWRPQTFTEVVGQEHITATLSNALATERVAHCYLFCGPRGVGKTTTARILSKALNCKNPNDQDPCQECPSCVSITEGTSLDVLEIDGASNNSVDDVRELREVVRYVPTSGSYKVYIIDEVHMLSTAAFNALLKTLEEPPERVVFVFATTEAQAVPDTILSRCQRFNFRRIPAGRIAQHLQMIAETDGISAEQEALYLLAQRADGALRDAESLMDQVASYERSMVTPEGVRQVLGLVDRGAYFDLTDALVSGHSARVLDSVAAAVDEGTDLEEFIKGYVEHVGQLLTVSVYGAADTLEIADTEKKRFEDLAPRVAQEDILRMLKTVLDLQGNLRRSAQPRFRIETALIRLAHMGSSIQVAELLQQVQSLVAGGQVPSSVATLRQGRSSAGPTAEHSLVQTSGKAGDRVGSPNNQASTDLEGEPSDPVVSGDPSSGWESIKSHWEAVVSQVKREQPTVGNFLTDARLANLDGAVLNLLFSPEAGFQMSQVVKNRATLERALASLTGQRVQIRCSSDDGARIEVQVPASEDKQSQENPSGISPNVRAVLDTFDGEVV